MVQAAQDRLPRGPQVRRWDTALVPNSRQAEAAYTEQAATAAAERESAIRRRPPASARGNIPACSQQRNPGFTTATARAAPLSGPVAAWSGTGLPVAPAGGSPAGAREASGAVAERYWGARPRTGGWASSAIMRT